jgi:hypothetical protein
MKTKIVHHADGRREIVRVLEGEETPDNGPLSREAAIVWLEDIAELPFVRQLLARQCKSRRGKLDLPGDEHLIGYAKLIKGTRADPETGKYARRVFYLRPDDRSAIRDGHVPADKHVVDPATILPTKAGKKPATAADGSASESEKRDDADSLDENVMQWLDDGTAPAAPAADNPTAGLDDNGVPFSNHAWLRETLGELVPNDGGEAILLEQPKLTIGRLDECDISIPKSSVSAVHCELFVEAGYWHVRDQNSTNGVRINGERVDPDSPKRIEPGATLSIAKEKFTLRYQPEKLGADADVSATKGPSSSAASQLAQLSVRWPRQKH